MACFAPSLKFGVGVPSFVQRNVALSGVAVGVCVCDSVGGFARLSRPELAGRLGGSVAVAVAISLPSLLARS